MSEHHVDDEPTAPDHATLAFEREKWKDELALRERELQLRVKESTRSSWSSPLLIAVLGAIAAGVGNLAVSFLNGQSEATTERIKDEQALILEAIKTDPDHAAENLNFLLDAGLISDTSEASSIRTYLKHRKKGQGPSIEQSAPLPPAVQLGAGRIVYIQYAVKTDEHAMSQLQSDLASKGFVTPGIQNVSVADFDGNVVKYFRKEDGSFAHALMRATNESLTRICPKGPKIEKVEWVNAASPQLEVWIQSPCT